MAYKYIYLLLNTRDGEREYSHPSVHRLNKTVDADAYADKYCKDFWGGETEKDGDGYYFLGGEVFTSFLEMREISKEHYDVLRQYM